MCYLKTALLFILVISAIQVVEAQDNGGVFYLQTAKERLDEGNCVKAQGSYEVYKKLTGLTNYDLEMEIQECVESSANIKIGKKIDVNGINYPIAYVDITGQHGWAVGEAEVCYRINSNKQTINGDDYYGYLDNVEVLNKEHLPSNYTFLTEDEFDYVIDNKSDIGFTGMGKYLKPNYSRTIEETTIEKGDYVIRRFYKISYKFYFVDLVTGGKEEKEIDNQFKARRLIRIDF